MRSVSLNARVSHDSEVTDETEVVLIRITHPGTYEVIRLSTDPTTRLSVDPLQYGTYSTWQTTDDSPFLFVLISTLVPDDVEDTPTSATLEFDNVDNQISELLRSTTDQATVDLAIVLANSPDFIETEWRGLKLISCEGDVLTVSLHMSRDPLTSEPYPRGRTTRGRFPGLRRR